MIGCFRANSKFCVFVSNATRTLLFHTLLINSESIMNIEIISFHSPGEPNKYPKSSRIIPSIYTEASSGSALYPSAHAYSGLLELALHLVSLLLTRPRLHDLLNHRCSLFGRKWQTQRASYHSPLTRT